VATSASAVAATISQENPRAPTTDGEWSSSKLPLYRS
jgi:hypothetical protein